MSKLLLLAYLVFCALNCAFSFLERDCPHIRACAPDPTSPHESLSQTNPARRWSVVQTGSDEDPFAAFRPAPLDEPRSIPSKGRFMDPDRPNPHFGIDYTDWDALHEGTAKAVYALGPGIVTAVQPCLPCWADGRHPWGQIRSAQARHNFGFGALVLIEHPYNPHISFYTLYAHLREIRVHVGQRVNAESVLGYMGISGDAAGPHLHLELRYGTPGMFWGADFSTLPTIELWLGTMYNRPAFLLYSQHHRAFRRELHDWAARQPLIEVAEESH